MACAEAAAPSCTVPPASGRPEQDEEDCGDCEDSDEGEGGPPAGGTQGRLADRLDCTADGTAREEDPGDATLR